MHQLAFLLLTFGALNSALSEGKNITFMDNFVTVIVIGSSNKKQLIVPHVHGFAARAA